MQAAAKLNEVLGLELLPPLDGVPHPLVHEEESLFVVHGFGIKNKKQKDDDNDDTAQARGKRDDRVKSLCAKHGSAGHGWVAAFFYFILFLSLAVDVHRKSTTLPRARWLAQKHHNTAISYYQAFSPSPRPLKYIYIYVRRVSVPSRKKGMTIQLVSSLPQTACGSAHYFLRPRQAVEGWRGQPPLTAAYTLMSSYTPPSFDRP